MKNKTIKKCKNQFTKKSSPGRPLFRGFPGDKQYLKFSGEQIIFKVFPADKQYLETSW